MKRLFYCSIYSCIKESTESGDFSVEHYSFVCTAPLSKSITVTGCVSEQLAG